MTIPPFVAHRGYQKRYPENTLVAIESALMCGAAFFEIDIQLTADEVPVLLHDADLMRTAGVPGNVFNMTLEQLRAVEVNEAARLGATFTGIHIPTLAAVVALLNDWSGATVFVEIKEESLKHFGTRRVMEAVMEVLSPAIGQCVPISFDREAVILARELGASAIGWAIERWDKATRTDAEALSPEYLFCDYKDLPPALEPLWPGPWKWVAYEVADPALALSLMARGIDLIETFAIEEILKTPLFRI